MRLNKKIMVWLSSAFFLASALSVWANQAQVNRLKNAVQSGQSRYFSTVSWTDFQRANYVGKGSTISDVCPKNYNRCLRALMGGLTNKDYKVRRAVYSSIRSISYPSQGQKALKKAANRLYLIRFMRHKESNSSADRSLDIAKRRISQITGMKYAGKKNKSSVEERKKAYNMIKKARIAHRKAIKNKNSSRNSQMYYKRGLKYYKRANARYRSKKYKYAYIYAKRAHDYFEKVQGKNKNDSAYRTKAARALTKARIAGRKAVRNKNKNDANKRYYARAVRYYKLSLERYKTKKYRMSERYAELSEKYYKRVK